MTTGPGAGSVRASLLERLLAEIDESIGEQDAASLESIVRWGAKPPLQDARMARLERALLHQQGRRQGATRLLQIVRDERAARRGRRSG
jgi:hypothetical protein